MSRTTAPETLVVVGAGPKAMAVAAKAQVMRDLGLSVPHIVVVESRAVGANWQSLGGWTDGQHRLGTSPEKDIGFPYRSTIARGHNRSINERMSAYSWMSFLIEHGTYSDWVDRGRPSPQHNLWAKYLAWVAQRAAVEIVIGSVTSVGTDSTRWIVEVERPDGSRTDIDADRLMMTGPGLSRRALIRDDRVLSIAEFWDLVGRRRLPAASRAAVIGGGETAGSALDELARYDVMAISVISPGATIYTRGESYFENSMFSNPAKWGALSLEERRDVIRRTDRGVFSVRVQDNLLDDTRISHIQGRALRAWRQGDVIALSLHNDMRPEQIHTFDLVVDATGGQPLWFLDLFDSDATDMVELAVGWPLSQERFESSIGYDLAIQGLRPTLYLPNLAGVAQGPGFPNLSCLGELSDRVLRPVGVGAGGPRTSRPAARPTTTRLG